MNIFQQITLIWGRGVDSFLSVDLSGGFSRLNCFSLDKVEMGLTRALNVSHKLHPTSPDSLQKIQRELGKHISP